MRDCQPYQSEGTVTLLSKKKIVKVMLNQAKLWEFNHLGALFDKNGKRLITSAGSELLIASELCQASRFTSKYGDTKIFEGVMRNKGGEWSRIWLIIVSNSTKQRRRSVSYRNRRTGNFEGKPNAGTWNPRWRRRAIKGILLFLLGLARTRLHQSCSHIFAYRRKYKV